MATANQQNIICGNCVFYDNFDSANLAKVEQVNASDGHENGSRETDSKFGGSEDRPDYEFNVWTKHDCHGTEYQNNNRTWFYFGVKPDVSGVYIKFNVVNLNRQSKMFSQGMCPVFKTVPGHPHWERIHDKPSYAMDQKGSEFTLSFVYRTPDNPKAISYLAFTYPFTYQDLQNYLNRIDNRMAKRILLHPDDIYYHRECAIKSLEGRRLEVLTISSFHNIMTEREDRLFGLFPDAEDERAFKFSEKKIIFMSARVHPGETPSSFVFNGFLNFLLNRDDSTAVILRRNYVFKLIPMLNPDGVARGHYRMDTRGVNLNRVYLAPSIDDHPTIFAAKSLIRYYHYNYEVVEEKEVTQEISKSPENQNNREGIKSSVLGYANPISSVGKESANRLLQQVTLMTLDEPDKPDRPVSASVDEKCEPKEFNEADKRELHQEESPNKKIRVNNSQSSNPEDSGLFLYIDMHGHASKKGVFMYGNYFDEPEDTITCMLLPKLMSMNNPNFHFTSCSFAERNMYLIDKRDGMSREGSGRVAVYKLTGLVRSYTLECNYNSGRLVNTLPARLRDGSNKTPTHMFVPPKYTPTVFEEVGAALGPSILDLTNSNPNSRLPNSQYRSLRGVKSFLKLTFANNHSASIGKQRNKDNHAGSITREDQQRTEEIVSSSTINCAADGPIEEEPSSRSETPSSSNVATKSPRIVRRSTSLFATIKRMKTVKKSRQSSSRNKPIVRAQRSKMNVENASKIGAVRSQGVGKPAATLLKPIGFNIAVNTNIRSIVASIANPRIRRNRTEGKKSMPKAASPEAQSSVGCEKMSVLKQGPKRRKIVAPRMTKTRPEIGESSRAGGPEDETATIPPPTAGVVRFRNKKPGKSNNFGRCRKVCLKTDTTKKLRKSAKSQK